ncbi:MAG: anaerobic ribonucleoside-triphosphate reductase activating protein [Sphaerochaeta sp.]|nr:anaerobic ribonucleoside-triphosphate reductase activating protein [Sphaerochaeta sp.]
MHIAGLQKMTLLDYPGVVACTVFLGGCNFRCPFCHNPDLVSGPFPEPFITEEEFFLFLEERKGFLDGVCITGGEPMANPDLEPFIREIRARGLLVKLDTNGSFPDRLERVVEERLVDYVAMDIKNSRERYGPTIGLPGYDTRDIERSAAILMGGALPYEFRTTLVREFHTEQDMLAIGKWLKGCRAYCLQSFVDSGNLLGKEVMTPFSEEEMMLHKKLLKSYIRAISIRGV